jgi:phage shock protein E
MKHYLLAIFLLITTVALAQQPAEKNNPDYKQLLQQVQKGEVYLIDVRTPEEYKEGNLEYSVNIDYLGEDFKTILSGLDKSKPVYVYCRSGNRSGKALDSLKILGFTHYYNLGGFEQLKAAGMPVRK